MLKRIALPVYSASTPAPPAQRQRRQLPFCRYCLAVLVSAEEKECHLCAQCLEAPLPFEITDAARELDRLQEQRRNPPPAAH